MKPRYTGWVVVLGALALLTLACESNRPVPLGSFGPPLASTSVNPSLARPDRSIHPFALGSLSWDENLGNGTGVDTSRVTGKTFGAGGGVIYQSIPLRDDWAWGGFAALQGRLSGSVVSTSLDPALGTPAQRALFGSSPWGIEAEGRIRAGGQVKFYLGTLAGYGLAAMRTETGDWASFRRSVDAVGNFYNASSQPTTIGAGWGLDLAFGSAGDWDFGFVLEKEYLQTRTQSLATATVNNVGAWQVTTQPGGKETWFDGAKLESYVDWGPWRFATALSSWRDDLGLSSFLGGLTWSAAYGW